MSSIRPSTLVVTLIASLVAARGAQGASNLTVEIKGDKCTATVNKVATGATARVEVKVPAEATGVKVFDTTTPPGATGKDFIVNVDQKKVPSPVGTFSLEVTKAEGPPEKHDCTAPKDVTLFSTKATPDAKGGTTGVDSTHDAKAQVWWATNGEAQVNAWQTVGAKLGLPGGTRFFVHLPSGNLAYPTSSAITEGTPMQVAILRPTDGATTLPGLRFDDCDAPNPQRIVPTAAATDDGKQGRNTAAEATKPPFEFLPLGPWHQCGEGKFTYHLTYGKSDAIDTTFRVRPKYHIAAILTLGYDFAKRKGFEKATDSTGMMTTIAETNEQVGAIAYVGAQWMIGGVDYEDLQPYNYFANVFLAVNVAAPLNDAIAGLALTLTGGVSVAAGVSVHSGQRLTNGAKVGDPFTGNGDIPTTGSWSGARPGIFVGVAVDSRVADALSSRFKGGSKEDTAKKSGGKDDGGKDSGGKDNGGKDSKPDSGGDSS